MKILIISKNENKGGAAKSSKRLFESLLKESIDVNYFVDIKTSDNNPRIISLCSLNDKIKRILRTKFDLLPLLKYTDKSSLFSPNNTFFTKNILKKIASLNPDIVHLHWVNKGMINIKDLLEINKPIVWTMHDSWLFTGGCHLPFDCKKFVVECNSCYVLGSNKEKDLSYKIFNLKKKTFNKLQINVVTPSNWLGGKAKESKLLKDQNINVIPNPIDVNAYSISDKTIARNLLGLPLDKTIILFGASSATSDINKGFVQLNKALNKIKSNNILLVVIGGNEPNIIQEFKFPVKYLGHINDEDRMNLAYNSANVSVVPSLSENLSNTILESLSCGIPTVAFDIGGNCDMIEHKRNGYLAPPYDIDELSKGIDWILNNKDYAELCENARGKVLNEFDSKLISKKHIELYKKVLNDF